MGGSGSGGGGYVVRSSAGGRGCLGGDGGRVYNVSPNA